MSKFLMAFILLQVVIHANSSLHMLGLDGKSDFAAFENFGAFYAKRASLGGFASIEKKNFHGRNFKACWNCVDQDVNGIEICCFTVTLIDPLGCMFLGQISPKCSDFCNFSQLECYPVDYSKK